MELHNYPVPLTSACVALTCALVLLTDQFAMPRELLRQCRPKRTVPEWLADTAARVCVIILIYAAFFSISWRPIYATQASVSFFVIFTGISRAKLTFIREPLLFSDIALVIDVFKYKEIFYATSLNILFWILALSYVFGASGLYLWVEPHILPEEPLLGIIVMLSLAFGPWLALFNARINHVTHALVHRLVPRPQVKIDTARFGTFTSVVLHFVLWLGLKRSEIVDAIALRLASAIDHFWLHGSHSSAPLVVVWQSESFIDLRHFGVTVNLPHLDAMRAAASQWGRMTSVFEGGYTLRTEFAVLSGLLPENVGVDAGLPYLRASHYKDVVWPQRLKNAGWITTFIHPYDKTFFFRHKALPQLGFDEMVMLDSFDHVPTKAEPYVSDMELAKVVVQRIAETDDQKAFLFVGSMANHGPWEAGRCGSVGTPLEIYKGLLEKADEALGYLVAKLNQLNRPVWLLFYGDHAPLLKSFADPFPDPRTDYFIVPLGEASRGSTERVASIEEAPWMLIDKLLEHASLKRELPG